MIADQEEAKPLPVIDTDNTDRKLGDLGDRDTGNRKGQRKKADALICAGLFRVSTVMVL
jgi:hypothetical protein